MIYAWKRVYFTYVRHPLIAQSKSRAQGVVKLKAMSSRNYQGDSHMHWQGCPHHVFGNEADGVSGAEEMDRVTDCSLSM